MIPRQNAKRTSYLALLVVCALLTVLKTSGLASSAHVNLASVETTRLLQRSSGLSTLVECGGYRNLSSFSDLFYRALNLDSSNERALLGAGRIEWLRGNCQAAAALFDEAVIQRPNDVMATFFWANSLLAQGEIIRAMDFYKEIDSSGAFFAVGQEIAYTQGRDAALKWYELSVAIEPTRKNVEALSSTYLNVKLDSKRALEAWEQLKNSSSQYTVDYWYASAQIAEITGNDSQAVLHYESAILLSQDAYERSVLHFRAGLSAMRLDHYELAKEHFNAAAQSEAVALESYLHLAEIEEFRGDTLASVRWLDLARKLNPTSELPDYQEGLHYWNKGDKQRAGVFFNRAHELNPLNASILFYLAVYEREFGDPGKAISLLEQAINAYPGTLPAYYISLADWYAQAGQCSDMLSTHERLRSLIGFDSAFEPVMVEQKKSCR